ncbi:DUF7706 family protein [Photorhabdus bodei]
MPARLIPFDGRRNDGEAYQIRDAIGKLQSALAYCGYAPR